MYLTREEEAILAGKRGEGLKFAMEIMVRMGEALKAEKLVDISSGHITMMDHKGNTVYPLLAQKLVGYGCKIKVPTYNNPTFMDFERPELGAPEMLAAEPPLLAGLQKLGASLEHTCTPFFAGIVPKCGEHVGWAEATAVAYVNSVLGARTNPLPAMLDLVAAILGKAPYVGLHLDENRRATIQVNVKLNTKVLTELEYEMLGFFISEVAGERVPVITGLPLDTPIEALQSMGPTIPSYMFHVVGVTPEAGTLRQACGGKRVELEVDFGIPELKRMTDKYAATTEAQVDVVTIGCPHCSFKHVEYYAKALDGKKVNNNVELVILTSEAVRRTAKTAGFYDMIEKSGAKLAAMCSLFAIGKNYISKQVLTTSAVYRMYGANGPLLASPQECIAAAVTGKFLPRRQDND